MKILIIILLLLVEGMAMADEYKVYDAPAEAEALYVIQEAIKMPTAISFNVEGKETYKLTPEDVMSCSKDELIAIGSAVALSFGWGAEAEYYKHIQDTLIPERFKVKYEK